MLIVTGDDFDEVDLAVPPGDDPDGVTIQNGVESQHFSRRNNNLAPKGHSAANRSLPPSRNAGLSSPSARNQLTAATIAPQTPHANELSTSANNLQPNQRSQPPSLAPQLLNTNSPTNVHQSSKPPANHEQQAQGPPQSHTPSLNSSGTSEHEPPIGFFTARAAETLQNAQGKPLQASPFNPRLESPSIRKTAGVDHTKTKPVNRDLVSVPPIPAPPARVGVNVVNPQTDKTRKVGMPGGPGSPLQNRGSYKPPTQMKRPQGDPSGIGGQQRSALGDVTSSSVNVPAGDRGGDVKRQRVGIDAGRGGAGMLNS